MHLAALSLGSNQQPEEHLRHAIKALCDRFPGTQISSAYRFPAIGFAGPDFVNAAALIQTNLNPLALNRWLHALEDQHGRDRSNPRYGNRTLDIDIVLFDDLITGEEGAGVLRLPRDELQHAFVLKPLAEIAPALRHPCTQCQMGDLWANHPQYADVFTRVKLCVGVKTCG